MLGSTSHRKATCNRRAGGGELLVEGVMRSRVGHSSYGGVSSTKKAPLSSASLTIPRHSSSSMRPPSPLDEKDTVLRSRRKVENGGKKDLSRPESAPQPIQDVPKSSGKLRLQEEKKPLWKRNPLRAFAHIGQQRFHVIFSMHVHAIHDLPLAMTGLRVTIHWKRKEEGVQTLPSRVFQGVAQFEETLRQRCTVYASSKSPTSVIKYEPKMFTLSVVVLDSDQMELGRHRLDLSRLLPQYAGDDQKPSSWTTSFNLTGKARGGSLGVTFSYDLVHHEFSEGTIAFGDVSESDQLNNLLNLPDSDCETIKLEHLSLGSEGGEVKNVKEEEGDDHSFANDTNSFSSGVPISNACTFFEFKPISKLDPHDESATPALIQHSLPQLKGDVSEDRDDGFDDVIDFVVEEKSELFPWSLTKSLEKHRSSNFRTSLEQENSELLHGKERMVKTTCSDKLDGDAFSKDIENHDQIEGCFNSNLLEDCTRFEKGSLDEEVEQVAGDFLKIYGHNVGDVPSGSESDSPRSLLLKHFEQEAVHEGGLAFGVDTNGASKLNISKPYVTDHEEDTNVSWAFEEDLELASIMEAAESELQKATQTFRSKTRAKMLENAETEALMQQWGLSEKAFESSPPKYTQGFYYPMKPSTEMLQPPPLAPGLGSVVRLRDGGTLRSMSPAHFKNSKSNGRLVMQVSRPLVVPAKSGATAVEILRHLAALGMENMALQAIVAMPLDDITGKSVEEIAGENFPEDTLSYVEHTILTNDRYASLDVAESQRSSSALVNTNRKTGLKELQSSSNLTQLQSLRGVSQHNSDAFDECVFLDDLAPLAMQNVEALAMDGLKIQSDLAEDEAPSYLDAAAWGILGDLQNREQREIGVRQAVAGMHFKDGFSTAKRSKESEDLLSMAISLEEWTRLDAGAFNDSESNERTLALLAAHNANYQNLAMIREEKNKGKGKHGRTTHGQVKSCGFMGNTLMIGMLVQLRDPFRNYEPVGSPMMALIQAERVMMPPKPRLGKRVFTMGNREEDDVFNQEATEQEVRTQHKVEESPQFKVTGVHVTGLKTGEDDKKKAWGDKKQQLSGSRWLIAQGMAKTSKHPLLKSKPTPLSTAKVQPGDTLWSISSRMHGTGEKWRESTSLRSRVRNPDVVFANDTRRTR